ncbi:MAG TPA: glycosyltransferase family 4 protein [Pseudolabrys sp.]|nr:glycosyltransferase family 4 protein [Pseudolabrys sp.]
MIGTDSLSGAGGPAIAALVVVAAAAAISFGILVILRPMLQRHALAHPNARSSHKVPTPQGGGIGVVVATLLVGLAAFALWASLELGTLSVVLSAAVLIAVVGGLDDVYTIPVLPRLALQAVAIAIVLTALPNGLRLLPILPGWAERVLLLIALLWFVNLVNFMDGLDWITVAEMVPVTAGVALIGALGVLSGGETIMALALCGALAGFAPLNRPVAKIFLGDVGSLAIGLLVGWLLALTALRGHLAAALLLPLYYLADASITLLRRLARGEPIWRAHRTHFYQRATEHGWSVLQIVGRVFFVNIVLAALAVATIVWPGVGAQLGAMVVGTAVVAALLYALSRDARA